MSTPVRLNLLPNRRLITVKLLPSIYNKDFKVLLVGGQWWNYVGGRKVSIYGLLASQRHSEPGQIQEHFQVREIAVKLPLPLPGSLVYSRHAAAFFYERIKYGAVVHYREYDGSVVVFVSCRANPLILNILFILLIQGPKSALPSFVPFAFFV